MKISLSWLCDHIDVADFVSRPEELARQLTAVGLEVEAVENRARQFAHVVVGHIKKLERHPNADRLTVCQVDAGEGSLRQIVCGAKNHKEGDKVVVTLPGAVLPGNFEIKKSKIRDVESLGMLASESELGLKAESEGILILPADAPVGQPFASYFGLDDVIFEINVTANRGDCLSHLGLARELSAVLGRPLISKAPEMRRAAQVSTRSQVGLEVKDKGLCSRYAGQLISGVKVGPSPTWLKKRLESVGMNSINNVVDVTNYVMMDMGQPLHAFDVANLNGKKISVDRSAAGEVFRTLDGTDLKLTGDELTIRDGERAVCIAGVIGGLNSGVTEKTTTVFLESAHFAMDSVRKTARRFGLETDSAYRFSRGTDASMVPQALMKAAQFIQEVAGGEVAADHWDELAKPLTKPAIALSTDLVEQRLGYKVSDEDLEAWLRRLQCQVQKASDRQFQVTPPLFRQDLEQAVDLIEEYGRLKGYDLIPETLPKMDYAPLASNTDYLFEDRVAGLLQAEGFLQTVNYGFLNDKAQAALLGSSAAYKAAGLQLPETPVMVKNPLNEDVNAMRISLLPGLLKNLLLNYRHSLETGRLFETGWVFKKSGEEFVEEGRVALVAWGQPSSLWNKNTATPMFFEVKRAVQALFDRLLIQGLQFQAWNGEVPSLLHPAQAATLFAEGRALGFVASLHPKWLVEEKVRVPVAVAEIDLTQLKRGQPRLVKYQPISKFPAVERDLAFVMPKTLATAEVCKEIKKISGGLLQSVDVFDVFSGGQLAESEVSVSFKMIFQDHEGTLTDEKLQGLQKQITEGVTKKLSIRVR